MANTAVAFDPSKPFEVVSPGTPAFDPAQPFEVVTGAETPGISASFTAPINKAVATVAGLPADFGAGANQVAMDAGTWLKRKVTGDTSDAPYPRVWVPEWIPTSENIQHWMEATGTTPSGDTTPQTTGERVASGAGEGLAAMGEIYTGGRALLQTGIEKSAPLVGKIIRMMTDGVVSPTPAAWKAAKDLAVSSGLWAGSGATGKLAEEVAPEEYKPVANLLGQLFGGGLMTVGEHAVEKAVGAGAKAAKSAIEPMTEAGQEAIAGRKFRAAATDKGMTAANLEDVKPLIDGSQPTIGQGTNDPGLMQLERTLAQKNAGPYAQRLAEQNVARVDAIKGLSAEDAQPGAVADYFRSAFDDIDRTTQQAIDDARLRAKASETFHGANATAAQGNAQAALSQVGGMAPAQDIGAALRGQLLEQEGRAKAASSRLWQAVDPTGAATVGISPFKAASFQLRSAMPKVAKPMEGEEKAIFDAVDGLPEVAAFRDLQALDSRIGSEIRALRGSPGADQQALRRLQILKDSIRDTMAGAAEGVAVKDAAALRAGTAAPQDTIFGRLQRDFDASGLSADARTGTAGPGGVSPAIAAEASPAGTGAPAAVQGSGVPAGGVSGGPAGAPGVPPAVSGPGVTAATADEGLAPRYRAAKAATLDQKQKFNQGPVGQVLQPGARGAPHAVMDSAVGDKLFVPGPKGGETIGAFTRSGGDPRQLQDHIAYSLRQAATRNGDLDINRYNAWVTKYRPALEALPPEITAPFFRAADAQAGAQAAGEAQTAALKSAQQFIDDATAARVQQMKDAQTGAARSFLNNPDDPVAAIGATLQRPKDWDALAKAANADPDLKAGAQRNMVDYLLRQFQGAQVGVGTDETILKGGQLDAFLKKNRASLSKLFTPEQIGMLDNVVADIQRQNLVTSSSKLPMGSNTPQDLANAGRYGGEMTVLDHLIREAGGAGLGAVAGGPAGAVAGGIAGRLGAKLQAAGLNRVDELLMQAVLDPQFGVLLLQKAGPQGPTPLVENMLLGRLAGITAAAYGTSGAAP